MAKFAGLRDPVTLDFENSMIAYCVDAFSISMGALMGTSPVTAFVESATGISGMSVHFISNYMSSISAICRGRKDWSHCHFHWTRFLCLCVFRTYFCLYPSMGDWRCLGDCWYAYGPKVRPL